ncbi:3,4-dihydroxy-2-butanone-4-phosphate synthase [Candidatus Woesearchaeota archaeon]|nr:3,4-dihydroxy-2-butanone-4-phosphate synthase [Candidatus Woesearchaeota archaeon]
MVQRALKDLKDGRFVIIVDDEGRENEGDLVMAAQFCSPEKVNFMLKHAKGLICVPITEKRAKQLLLPRMVPDSQNTEVTQCKFTVSVDFKKGTTTGISAKDRSATIQALSHLKSKSDDFSRPGHVFPLVAEEGGVLKRDGHTEAVIDLLKLASLKEIGVLCEILNEEGNAAARGELELFAKSYGFSILSIKDLIAFRREHE